MMSALVAGGVQSPSAQSTAPQGQSEQGTRGSAVRPKRGAGRQQTPAPSKGAQASASKAATAEAKSGGASADASSSEGLGSILAVADFDLVGLAVTASPATQTVPKNTPTAVLVAPEVPEGTDLPQFVAALNPNFRVRGELVGPSLSAPLTVEAPVGQPMRIPALSQAGDHVLQNLRVIDAGAAGAPVVAAVTPDSCGIVVIERILVSEVHVNELTFEQIRQAGIVLSDDSYRAFNFTLGLATSSGAQQISIPVAFPEVGVNDPRPIVGAPSISGPGVDVPTIVPVMLGSGLDAEGGGNNELPQFGGADVRIPGVVVFPGRVGFLHQFFEAIVIVANGAPNGAPLVLRGLHAKAKLPDAGTPGVEADDPLRIAETQTGGRVTELDLHGLGADSKYGTPDDALSFGPGESGQGTFLLEGLKEGLHTVNFDLEATLEGLPTGPIQVKGEVPGAVLVRDASFAVTFTHPAIVRAGQQYDLGMTLYNSGASAIRGAFAQLNPDSVSGATLVRRDAQDVGKREFETDIPSAESSTVKWRLRANVTGEVTATYVKVGEGVSAGIALVTGVGDRNVPLSPDSLILPDPVRHLPPGVVEAGRALLGQAWSIANAPAGSLPRGVAPVTKQTVINRAVEMGIAGMRVDFHEPVATSLGTLGRDWLGELKPDAGFADATRNTPAGFDWYDALGAEFFKRMQPGADSLTPSALHQRFAEAESARSPFISVLATQPEGEAHFGARLLSPAKQPVGFGATPDERAGELQSGGSIRLDAVSPVTGESTGTAGQMLVVSNPDPNFWTLEIQGWRDGPLSELSLVYPATSRSFRTLTWSGVQIAQGRKYRVVFKPLNTSTTPALEFLQDNTWQPVGVTPTSTTSNQPAPQVVGVVQVTPDVVAGGDKYGRLVGLLFSKPMSRAEAETLTRYRVGGGALRNSQPAEMVGGPVKVTGAHLDYGDRFVFLGLDSPVGPYIDRDLTVSGLVDARRMQLAPAPTTAPIEPRVSPEGRPPGAYLTGRVMNADGTPVANAPVIYWVQECDDGIMLFPPPPAPIALRYTDAQGRYSVDYVRDGDCAPLSVTVNDPTTKAEKRLTSPVAYDGQHMVFDLVFLARGNVQGAVTSGGRGVPKALVRIVPDLDALGTKVVETDENGRYGASDVPVGNVSVTAVGTGDFRTASGLAAGTIPGPNLTASINVALQDISGVVSGRVIHPGGAPAPGLLVVAYARIPGFSSTRPDGAIAVGYAFADREGAFRITNLPVGSVSLEVRDYVTGTNVTQAVQLTAAQTEVNGVLITLGGLGAVSGRVTNEVGAPVVGASVGASGGAVKTDANGDYTLPGLPEGNLTVTATDPATGLSGSALAPVRRGETTGNINITILRPAKLQGHVYILEEGASAPRPASGALITADGFQVATADQLGAYTLNNLPPNAELTLRFVDVGKGLVVNTPVRLQTGETLTRDATFKPGTIRGRVFQPDGVTTAVAPVTAYVPRPVLFQGGSFGLIDSDQQPVSVQSGTDGRFEIKGANPGLFRVSTSSPFFPTRVTSGGDLPPHGVSEVDLTLVSTLAGKIQGRVFQPDGTTPVGAGVRVSLSGGSLAEVTVRTDETGHYEFAEVFSAGGYQLTAADPLNGNTNRISVSVEKNKDAVFDLRLLGRGALRVRVVDGAGNPATSGSITLDGSSYPNNHRHAEIAAAGGGVVEFDNLAEGPYAVSAAQRGLGGRASATVPLGSTVEVTIQLQASATVKGKVFMPGGAAPIGLADVELRLGGRSVGFSVTSDAEEDRGSFTFLNVPVGDFTLDVFDNRTGRVGRSAGRLTAQGEVAVVNVELLPVGAVAGRVTANGQPVDHALVQIYADGSGVRGAQARATTDPDGRFRFTGIPVGRFTVNVSDAPGGQTGSASGTVAGTVEPLADTVADVTLEPSQTVTGTVFRRGGAAAVPGAQVMVYVNGRGFRAATNEGGVYRLTFVPLGEVRVRAEAPTGYDRGESAAVAGNTAGGTVNVNVTLGGTGDIQGTALDSNGAPLQAGTVTYTNDAWGTPVLIIAAVQSDGHFDFKGAPAGPFALKLVVPNRVGVGSAAGAVAAEQTTNVNVRLEDAGRVVGTVKTEGGAGPAVGADVVLTLTRPAGQLRFYAHTDSQGAFSFENVLLGTVNVNVTGAASRGLVSAGGVALSANGQTVDLGELRLDATPISVTSVNPADGANDVQPTSAAVTLTFSEPAQPATVNAGTVRLLQGAAGVPATLTLAPDGRTATLTPSARLADTTAYTVAVAASVADLNGLTLGGEFRSTFTTLDATGPVVTGITPANNATRVALSTDVVVTFNEKLDPAQDLSQVVAVTADGAPPAAVAGTHALAPDGLSVTFHSSDFLGEGLRHTVTVQGQRDLRGNATSAVSSSVFTTIDLMPPVIDPLPIGGKTVRTFRPQITAAYRDNASGVNVSTVVLTLDGANVTSQASVSATGLSFTPAAPLARGPHTVTLSLSDNQGNAAQQATASFTVDDAGPAISAFQIAGLPASNDMFVTSTLQPGFVVSYTDDTGVNLAATKLLFGPFGSTLQPVAATVTQTSLGYTPAAPLAEGRYSVEAVVVNNLGTSSTTGRIDFTLDMDAPDLLSSAPAGGSQHGGTAVTITGNRLLNTTGTAPAVSVGGNAAQVLSAVAGSPDQVVIVTPAGVPGPAAIQLTTNRGEGVRPAAFNYEADPRTPFISEPDTVFLWHMDETGNGGVRINDYGPTHAIAGTAAGTSSAQPGRFAGGRKDANIQSETSLPALYMGGKSFTVEGWVKTGAVGRTYTLLGKEDMYGYYYGPPEFALRLLPTGSLRALLYDSSQRQWFVDLPASTYPVADDQWHYLAMVADRTANRLSIYVDGVERVFSTTPPANFGALYNSGQPFRVGHWAYYEPQTTGGPEAFPGTVDEVRLSSTAHSAAQIQKTYLGTEGTLGVSIVNSGPVNVPAGAGTEIQLEGYNLAAATPSVTGPAGAQLSARVLSSSATQSRVLVTAPADAALGDAQLVMSSVQRSASLSLRVIDLSRISLAVEPDTKLLWHMDETGSGPVGIVDAGRLHINGSAGGTSTAQPGRFAGGRKEANIASATSLADLYMGSSSFTVEGWMKTGTVGRTYTLFGKEDMYSGYYGPPEYGVRLTPAGGLRALLYDTGHRQWFVDMPATVYRVDDNLWHYVVLVVDRTNTRLSLYVDGVERAYSTAPPAGFGALYNSGQPFRAGHWAYYEPQTTGGPEGFPGTLDEIRVSSTAHSAERILNDLTGNSPMRITSYTPREILREKEDLPSYTNQFTVDGYNLDGVTARLQVNGQDAAAVVNVTSSTYRQAAGTVNAAPTVPLGNGQLIFSKPGQADVAVDVRVGDQAQSAAFNDTVLLWNLNETGNGAVRVLDAGALGIHGTSGGLSQAQPGHFGGGRAKALVTSDGDNGSLKFGTSSFTAECWFKAGVLGRSYTLVGKEDTYGGYFGPPEFAIRLLPTGGLRALAYDTGHRQWKAEMPASAYEINDNQWHHAAMVVDRLNGGKLSLYVDGVERASAAPPSGFAGIWNSGQQLRAGKWAYYDEQTSGGPEEFPGVIDDVRVSASAHTAEQIVSNMNGVPGLRVNSYSPQEAPRNKATGETFSTLITLAGFGLDGVSASLTRNGQPLDATALVESSAFNQAQVRLSFNSGVATGTAQLVLTKPGVPAASVDVRVYEQSELATDIDTRLLWHMNETGNGSVRVTDSGPLGIHGTSGGLSQAQPGHFGGGRAKALVTSDGDFGALAFGTSSFTAECWFKTGTNGRSYTLVGKEDTYGGYFGPPEFAIRLLPTGGLRALAYDTGHRQWKAEAPGRTYDPATGRWVMTLDDNQWHHAAMVVDRANNKLTLYIDGVERASAAAPSGFAGIWNSGQQLRAGKWAYYDEQSSGGPEEFPGVVDEVRISSSAHTAEKVLADALGTDTARISLTQPTIIQRGSANVPLTFTGNGLSNATVTTGQPGVSVAVVSSSPTRLDCLLTVPAEVPVGVLNLAVAVAGGQVFNPSLTVVDQQPFVNAADDNNGTLALWHMDETGNGAVRVNGAGDAVPAVVGGSAHALSQAQTGRFGGARAKASITADTSAALNLGTSSFTVECWVKPGANGRSYTLVGKEDTYGGYFGPPEFALRLLPTGAVRALAYDTGHRQWKAEMPARLYDATTGTWQITVNDGQWHYLSMVVDRTGNRMTLYADGVERASSTIPSGFGSIWNSNQPMRAAKWAYYDEQTSGGPEEFPGALDEVRVLNFARTAAQVRDTWLGTNTASSVASQQPASEAKASAQSADAQPEITVDAISPGEVVRDKGSKEARTTVLSLKGTNLAGVRARVMRDGQPLKAAVVNVQGASDAEATLSLAITPKTPLGPLQLVLSKPGHRDAEVEVRVVEPSEFPAEADTVGLWHLDERDEGAARLLDSGERGLNLNAAAASRVAAGRFGSGRALARAASGANSEALSFGASSFTVEGWVKAGALGRDYTLFGKEADNGQNTEYTLKLTAAGTLRAEVYDTNGALWQAETSPDSPKLTDDEWHSVALVLDRAANIMLLYVDGRGRAIVPAPPDFLAIRSLGQPLVFGAYDADSAANGGPEEFPGVIDEVRVSSTAHRAEKINADYFGHDAPEVTLVRTAAAPQAGGVGVTLHGHGLGGVNVTAAQPDVKVSVKSLSRTRVELLLSVPEPRAALGLVRLTLEDALGQTTTADVDLSHLAAAKSKGRAAPSAVSANPPEQSPPPRPPAEANPAAEGARAPARARASGGLLR
jgi:hypothetical protein